MLASKHKHADTAQWHKSPNINYDVVPFGFRTSMRLPGVCVTRSRIVTQSHYRHSNCVGKSAACIPFSLTIPALRRYRINALFCYRAQLDVNGENIRLGYPLETKMLKDRH
ncbi:hypothetical protein [Trueperella sp. LYQ141]|uniref:hypothetical protein n=1 Tax=Trueperella sp. LYQ141 TaxID=3391058 RepID=UPI0039831B19